MPDPESSGIARCEAPLSSGLPQALITTVSGSTPAIETCVHVIRSRPLEERGVRSGAVDRDPAKWGIGVTLPASI